MLDKLYIKVLTAKLLLAEKLKEQSGEVNIVAIVVLIGIAVLLAIFFRGQIQNLLNSLFGTINNSATDAIQNKG